MTSRWTAQSDVDYYNAMRHGEQEPSGVRCTRCGGDIPWTKADGPPPFTPCCDACFADAQATQQRKAEQGAA